MSIRLFILSLVFSLASMSWAGVSGMGGLCHEWSFEQNFDDTSGNGNDGTAYGDPTFTTDTGGGSWAGDYSCTFDGGTDGDNDYVWDLDSTGLPVQSEDYPDRSPAYSINLLVKMDHDDTEYESMGGFGTWGPSVRTPRYVFGDGRKPEKYGWFRFEAYGMHTSWEDFLPLNEWHMATVTFELTNPSGGKGTLRFYADGVLMKTKEDERMQDTQGAVYAGLYEQCNYGNEPLNGQLDELTIWDHALSQSEIDTLYTNYIPEPATIALLGLGGLAFLRRKK